MSDGQLGIVLRTTGATMPADFPSETYDTVNDRAVALGHPSDTWKQFATAWNGVAYRFLAAAESEERLSASLELDGTSPAQPARTRQELDIYAFSSAGTSAIECFGFAMYTVCAMLEDRAGVVDGPFKLDTEKLKRRVSFENAARAIGKTYPGDGLAVTMQAVLDESDWSELEDWREVGFHRGQPGRWMQRGVGPDPLASDSWGSGVHREIDVALDGGPYRDKRRWLAHALQRLVAEADVFLERRTADGTKAIGERG